jgi:HKD family nuclease
LLRAEEFSIFFQKHARESRTIKVAVAYLRRGGYEQVREAITAFLANRASKCVFVIGLSSHYVTEPLAVKRLLELQSKFPNQVEVRYSSKRAFHLKIFLFEKESVVVACVGSSNLTGGGTAGNLEANIAIEGSPKSAVLVDISRMFSELACKPTSEVLSEYRWKEYANDFTRGRVSNKTHFKPTLKPTGDVGKPGAFPDMSEDDLEEIEDRPERAVWKISPGKGAFQWREYVKRIDKSTNVGPIAMGWHSIGDPSDMTWNDIRNSAREKEKKPTYVADQIWQFFHLLRP